MKKYISIIAACMMAVSCVDTVIIPDDKTVDEDFWKNKSQVQQMVMAAYQGMLSENVIARLIVWGGLRSDELLPIDKITGDVRDDLRDINLANIQPDNMYAEWSSLYAVINRCNVVLLKARDVVGVYGGPDPSYTEGDYQADCAEMKALRALCYFYLLRNYRDVPMMLDAVMNSSEEYDVEQSAPSVVLDQIIADLTEAEQNMPSSNQYESWQQTGRLTKQGIQALLADVYLWRAAMTHNAADYEQVIQLADKIFQYKKDTHQFLRGEAREEKDFYLEEGKEMFKELFIKQNNSNESLFELEFAGVKDVSANMAVCKYFAHYSGTNDPYLFAASNYKYGGATYISGGYTADWRGSMNTYDVETTVGDFTGFPIRKYVSNNFNFNPSSISTREAKNRTYSTNYQQNYMIYRLTDVMLMKAEALVALATADDDTEHLNAAFELVKTVNSRSRESTATELDVTTYNTIEKMETIVLSERARELAFEGKRWYDLLRYAYRHMEGVDITKTLAQINDEGGNFAVTYDAMLKFVEDKLSGKGAAVTAKMKTEPSLYMPVPQRDIYLAPSLRQNPAYSLNEIYSKN